MDTGLEHDARAMAAAEVILCGVVTGLKGRVGWLLVGFLLGGVPWLVSAWLPATAASLWARRRPLDGHSG